MNPCEELYAWEPTPHLGRKPEPCATLLRVPREGACIWWRRGSPDLSCELVNAIMDAHAAHSTMSTQALSSQKVQDGLKDILLGPADLYEALRAKANST
jgi:hypothetical protein